MKRFVFLIGLISMLAAVHAATTVTGAVKWTAPLTDVNGNPAVVTSYNIYAGTTTGACSAATPLTLVGSTVSGITTYTATGVVPGTTICVAVTALNSAANPSESARSSVASFSPPLITNGTPAAPTNVTITIIVAPAS